MAKFEVVPDAEFDPEPAEAARPPEHQAALNVLMLSLKALSQRTLIALDNLFMLLTVGSVFWLAMSIREPNTFQLILISVYAVFVLAANVIVRR